MANKTDFADQSAEARKKRLEMPADEYGKMVDKEMGKSEEGKKGDYNEEPDTAPAKKTKGGAVKKYMKYSDTGEPLGMVPVGSPKNAKPKGMSAGGSVGSASRRADGCAQRGKTKGRMV